MFAALCGCAFVFIAAFVVETRHKSLAEVQALFRASAGETDALLPRRAEDKFLL